MTDGLYTPAAVSAVPKPAPATSGLKYSSDIFNGEMYGGHRMVENLEVLTLYPVARKSEWMSATQEIQIVTNAFVNYSGS